MFTVRDAAGRLRDIPGLDVAWSLPERHIGPSPPASATRPSRRRPMTPPIRAMGPQVADVADQWFFETVVRVHRPANSYCHHLYQAMRHPANTAEHRVAPDGPGPGVNRAWPWLSRSLVFTGAGQAGRCLLRPGERVE